MANPTQKAFSRDYWRGWRGETWRRALDLERRVGLLATAGLAVGLAIAERAVGVTGSLGGYLLAVVAFFFVVFGLILAVAWFSTPAYLAWKQRTEEEEDGIAYQLDSTFETPKMAVMHPGGGATPAPGVVDGSPGLLAFPMRDQKNRFIMTTFLDPSAIRAVRIYEPVEVTIRPEQLPFIVRIGWRARLIVKAFSPEPRTGILFDERGSGRMIRAEVYPETDTSS